MFDESYCAGMALGSPNRARRTDQLQGSHHCRYRLGFRAAADPHADTFDFNLDAARAPSHRVSASAAVQREGRAGNVGSTTAGTNFGASASLAAGWRACRRQVNTCCGVSPFRRATSETTAPATSVSSIIPALKSSENWRRRPVPVITSSRRTAIASGLSVSSSVDTSRSRIQRSHNRPSPSSDEGGITTAVTLRRMEQGLPGPRHDARRHRSSLLPRHHRRNKRRELSQAHRDRAKTRAKTTDRACNAKNTG